MVGPFMQRRRLASVALGVIIVGLIVTGYLVISEAQNPEDPQEPDELCEIDEPDNRT
ncbi:MAG: hypothetical protein KAQ65_04305 [Candidatus Thorarchaeota archaeon]|nr:hypothetical protein [Candidatus Thorarchaeota archaeon]